MLYSVYVIFSIYLIISVIVFIRTLFEDKLSESPSGEFISVVIAARNEEKNIANCLESLQKQSCSENNYEVIVVDDHSEDKTCEFVKDYDKKINNFSCLTSPEGENGKRKALIYGLKNAKGRYIFHTDADCIVPRSWLNSLSCFLDKGYSIIGGFTLVNFREKIIHKIQALDWMYIQSVGTAISRIYKPFSLFGNNIAFKREDYEQTGGYEKMEREYLIDYQLVQQMMKKRGNKGILILNRDTVVFTNPLSTWKEYLAQRKRWSIGALHINPGAKILLFLSFLTNVIFVLSPFITEYFYLILAVKLISDFLIVINPVRIFKQYRLILTFLLFEIFFTFHMIIQVLLFPFSGKITWKERKV